jgi:hypothetical protein
MSKNQIPLDVLKEREKKLRALIQQREGGKEVVTEKRWWELAERECPVEYGNLISAMSAHNPQSKRAIKLRLSARKALDKAMRKKGWILEGVAQSL